MHEGEGKSEKIEESKDFEHDEKIKRKRLSTLVNFVNFTDKEKRKILKTLDEAGIFASEVDFDKAEIVFVKGEKIPRDSGKKKFLVFVPRETDRAFLRGLVSAGVREILFEDELDILPFVVEREIRDIKSENLREFSLRWISTHDVISGFLTRKSFLMEIEKILKSAKGKVFALFVVQINYFDTYVVQFGADFVDMLVDKLAERISSVLSPSDIPARISERKFAIFKEFKADDSREFSTFFSARGYVNDFALKLLSKLSEPLNIGGRTLRPSCSLGVALWPFDSTSPDGLLSSAESAVSERKPISFREESTQKVSRQVVESIFLAIKRNEFYMVYQPILNLSSGKFEIFEALLRWEGNEKISPQDIITASQISGLIGDLTKYIFESVAKVASRSKFKFSINILPEQFFIPGMDDEILEILKRWSVEPERIMFELSEKSDPKDIRKIQKILDKFSKIGIRVVIDDFGSGQSSVNHLKNFSYDIVKFDGTLVNGMKESKLDMQIVKSMIYLCHSTGMKTVAEGVENEKSFELSQHIGFDYVQGFFISKPLREKDVLKIE